LNMLESSFSSTFFIIIGMNQVSPTSNLEWFGGQMYPEFQIKQQ
jgi:hypothetical protein